MLISLLTLYKLRLRSRRDDCFNFTCFGCGIGKSKNSEWKCNICLFENDFDQNGFQKDIERKSQTNVKYCKSTSKNFESSAVFCAVCITNQSIVMDILKGYKESAHGDLNSYRKSLEVRYPPVCPNCEPKGILITN